MKDRFSCDQFAFERPLWQSGLGRVAGVDEAGRGPLAGPVVAAAAVLPPRWLRDGLPPGLEGLNDSKQLTSSERDGFFAWLTADPEVDYAIGCVDAESVDQINILQATHRAMDQALAQLRSAPEHVLGWRPDVGVSRNPCARRNRNRDTSDRNLPSSGRA